MADRRDGAVGGQLPGQDGAGLHPLRRQGRLEVELVAHMGFSAAVAEDLANGMIVVVAGERYGPFYNCCHPVILV